MNVPLWTTVAVICAAPTVRVLIESYKDRSYMRRSGTNGVRAAHAEDCIRYEWVRLAAQAMAIAGVGMSCRVAAITWATIERNILFMGICLALSLNSIMALRGRRRIMDMYHEHIDRHSSM